MSEEVSRSDHIDFFYVEDRVLAGDLHKAVEAQGRIAIAAIRGRLNANIPEGDLAAISAWLDVLAAMLACQGNPTRDCSDVVLYSEFTDEQALQGYAAHPLHQAIVPFVVEAASERRVVDYRV